MALELLAPTRGRDEAEEAERMATGDFEAAFFAASGARWSQDDADLLRHILAHWTADELAGVFSPMARTRPRAPRAYLLKSLESIAIKEAARLAALKAEEAKRKASKPQSSSTRPTGSPLSSAQGLESVEDYEAEAERVAMWWEGLSATERQDVDRTALGPDSEAMMARMTHQAASEHKEARRRMYWRREVSRGR